MENSTVNNSIMGFLGAVNMNSSDGQSSGQEGKSADFLSILSSMMGEDCLKCNVIVENALMVQQPSIRDIYPLLFGLLENISHAALQKGKDTDIVNGGMVEDKAVGEEGSGKEEDGTVLIDLAGANTASIQSMLELFDNISEVLSNPNSSNDGNNGLVKTDFMETIHKLVDNISAANISAQENISDDVILIPAQKENEKAGQKGEGREEGTGHILSTVSPGAGRQEETKNPVPVALTDNTVVMSMINNSYLNIEQSGDNKGEGSKSLPISRAGDKIPTEYFVLGASNRKDSLNPVSSEEAKEKFIEEADDNIEILVKNAVNPAKQPSGKEREDLLLNHQKVGSNIENAQGEEKENVPKILFSQEKIPFDEPGVKLNEDIAEPQNGDLKLTIKENEYLPYARHNGFENSPVQETHNHKGVNEASFASAMTEKIEKVIEQYSAKGTPMDMVVRLKIDDGETLLVGLKNEGQRVMVDVRTTDGGVINLLQSQKDVITRNLEGKNIYTNIFVDPNGNGNFERREERRANKESNKQNAKKQKDFIEVLETV